MAAFVAVAAVAVATQFVFRAEARPQDVPAPAARSGALDDRVVLDEIDALWRDVTTTAGGYGDAANLVDPPSLYATAWNLRLAARASVPLPAAARTATVRRLHDALADRAPHAGGLPLLYRTWLATHALTETGEPYPVAADEVAESLRTGARFGFAPGEPPSWAATQVAVEMLALGGRPAPAGLAAEVRAALPTVTAETVADDPLSTALPVWQLATRLLPAADRQPYAAGLAGLLRQVATRSERATSGVSLGVLVTVRELATAHGLTVPLPTARHLRELRLPDGYLGAAAPGSDAPPQAEPQVTFNGVVLGLATGPTLRRSLLAGLGPEGWRTDVSEPRPESSYFAAELTKALGGHERGAALRALGARWVADAGVKPAGQDVDWRRAYFALHLARTLTIPVPERVRARVREALASDLVSDGADAGLLLDVAGLAGVTVSPAALKAVADRLSTATLGTMKDVLAAYTVGTVAASEPLVTRARDAARALAHGDAFRYSARAPLPDLLSTATAARVLALDTAARVRAVAAFTATGGVALEPADGDDTIELRTTYLGYWLLGRTGEPPVLH